MAMSSASNRLWVADITYLRRGTRRLQASSTTAR